MNGFESADMRTEPTSNCRDRSDHRAIPPSCRRRRSSTAAGRLQRLVAKLDRPRLIRRRRNRPNTEKAADKPVKHRLCKKLCSDEKHKLDHDNNQKTIEGRMAEYVTAMIGGHLFRPSNLACRERVHAGTADAGSAVVGRDRRRAQSARPHRHRGRHARPPRPAEERRRQAADGGRRRPARRVLRPADRPDRRGACGWPTTAARKTPSISIPAWPSSPAASIASTASSWSSSTSIASSKSCPGG